jgi:phosphotriesterase-related protein
MVGGWREPRRLIGLLQLCGGLALTDVTRCPEGPGELVLDVLRSEGVDLSRVILGHTGEAVRDPDYLQRMAGAGLRLGMDRFGIDHFVMFEQPSDLVVELCRRGLADRMVLAQNTCGCIDWSAAGSLARSRAGTCISARTCCRTCTIAG